MQTKKVIALLFFMFLLSCYYQSPLFATMTVSGMLESSPTWHRGYSNQGYTSESTDPLAPFSGHAVMFKGFISGGSNEMLNGAYLVARFKIEFDQDVTINSVSVFGAGDNMTQGNNAVLRLLDENMNELAVEPLTGLNVLSIHKLNTGGVLGSTFYIDEFDYSSVYRYRKNIDINFTQYPADLAARIIYVDADATGSKNGSSWADAYWCLQNALADAKFGDEIQVAQGTYRPDHIVMITRRGFEVESSGDRTTTFQLKNGVIIKGGYAGFGEPNPDAWNIELYETILSGDLNGDDGPGFANNAENSYHVVTGSGTNEAAVLEGFTITGGNANSSSPDDKGSGMQNNAGSPTVLNCTFSENSAKTGGGMSNSRNSGPMVIDCTFNRNRANNNGGGMRNNSSSPTVINCKFIGNSANNGGGMNNRTSSPSVTNCTFTGNSANNTGGGMRNSHDSYPNLRNCTFSGNSAGWDGGGMSNMLSHPTLMDCVFRENSADEGGGGMHNHAGNPTLLNCTFSDNSTAKGGGGMDNYSGSRPALTNCAFSGNSAGWDGGGMSNVSSHPTLINCVFNENSAYEGGGGMHNGAGNPTLLNCTFSGNSTDKGGGGMNNYSSSPVLTNCVFSGNSADCGGGIDNRDDSRPRLLNCTISANFAVQDGGGISNFQDSQPVLVNCILWSNTDESGTGAYSSQIQGQAVVSYSCVQNSRVRYSWSGEGNINVNPCFMDADGIDDVVGTEDDDLRLSPGSPCIDAGDNSAIPQSAVTDLDGNPRIINGIVDMGAYEAGEEWPFAFNPKPADGAQYVYQNVELSWSYGFGAQLHIVYFGDNFDDVNIDAGGIIQETTTYSPGPLEWDKVYYWRVDEFDGAVIRKGDIWSFRTIPEIDPNLIGWWRFDEGSGNIAYDSSGHGNNGTFNGNPQWVSGYSSYALDFDGSGDWLDCGEDPSLQITDAVTIAAWIKVSAQGIDHKIGGNQDGVNGGYKMTVYSNNRIEFEIRTASNRAILNRDIGGGTLLQQDIWYHVTGVYSLEDGYIRTYVNGLLDREKSTTDVLGASLGPFRIGCEPFETGFQHHHFSGVMDDIRIFNRDLTEGEVLRIMEEGGEGWSYAFNPKPADGAINPNTWVRLSWSPGGTAVSHDVYFGDNFEDVEAGTEDTFQGNQTETYFAVGSARDSYLAPGVTYYWRIDEVEADGVTIHKGDIWSFSIPRKTAYAPNHFEITYYDNYNYETGQWDAWQSVATPRDAWDDKYLADGSSGNTVFTDHAFPSIAVFNLRGNLFSKDGHASGGDDWNPLQSIGDNVSGQSAHHVFAALFKGLIYLEEGDVLWLVSDDDAYIFLDDDTVWGQEVLSVPFISHFRTDSMIVTSAQAGYHVMTVKYIERRNKHSGIEITLNGEHLQNAEVSDFEDF